jgi:PAS domain S-box-containing protein
MSILAGDDREAIREIIDCIGAPVTLGDLESDGTIRVFAVNRAAADFYGVPAAQVEGRSLDDLNLQPEGRVEVIKRRYHECLKRRESLQFRDFAPVDTVFGRRWVHTTMSPLIDEVRNTARVMATLTDVTDLKQTEDFLSDTLTQALSGFIPICAACKKVRQRDDTWLSVERYVTQRSRAHFSHTMCPQCAKEWYGKDAEI